MKEETTGVSRWRRLVVLGALVLAFSAVLVRGVDLQVVQQDFLRGEGDARHLRVVALPAHRGMIMDRQGEPMAVSTPVDTVWANPQEVLEEPQRLQEVAQVLGVDPTALYRRVSDRAGREFVYLRRHVTPEVGARVSALGVPGVGLQREYRRYYPMGEVASHVLGFTNIDDHGQEGIELGYNAWLTGEPGAKRVLRDRLGRVIRDVENIRPASHGQDLRLTIDQRLQYLAYRELKAAVSAHGARAGSAVILDARNGDVLAMVNQPSYNPNNRETLQGDRFRNRAVTDLIEPGSTIKPFTVAAALESGQFQPETLLETSPGTLRVGRHTIRDIRNYGLIDLSTLLVKSSNVGASKLAMAIEPQALWETFFQLGFGRATGSGFPGEAGGTLRDFLYWREVDRATLAFGYGVSVSMLQLAQAYAAIANDGVMPAPRFVQSQEVRPGEQVMHASTARTLVDMLEASVEPGGTGVRARVEGYRVAGKTGTVRKSGAGGYTEGRYLSLFAGMAPASNPRLVMVVMVDEPSGDQYYGGQVAAPVFSNVMRGALRLMDIPPDDLPALRSVSGPGQGNPA
ncbi:peptidoglycan D,D-transpeptidase FtsI family protein [Ectothiorhodospira variabilis]|uniref:peptidoglycan D,D-transpeptidase FtsI family protein n=1 Tax=Ectothiorhodospira variabilis TaxID=505694 RepID=UPI001EFA662A|nr:penicillin-binding protein 2 [Ectothiorhodospira variabilis]MCG5493405.1 penicillin-binding protein 2 [Ectothiorhodospira variabilis]MCG5496751.1 penicillin-binding protein 2 [Ectothiorhodospira variabilis]MCG5502734.1 penicillin-binding protein 2 [Ectothiorhodospira variabilis]MCG5505500.1 penicillin-binding protein 2 [Ectothiorhodospira variabilis]